MTVTPPAAVELTFTRMSAPNGRPIPAGIEITGRGYRRMPTGPLYAPPPEVATWRNLLPILWPQAPVDWGFAPWVVLLRLSDGTVAASAPTPIGFTIRAGDQPRIGRWNLTVAGVAPGTARPYGTDRYSESLYSVYPVAGAIFFAVLFTDFEWTRQANDCAPWQAAPAIAVGGCA